MLSKEKRNKIVLCAFFMLHSVILLADDIPDDEEEIDPPPAAPIDDYVPLMLFIGVVLVFYVMYRQRVNLKTLK